MPRSTRAIPVACSAGLETGDLIVRFDAQAVDGIDELHRLLTAERIGQTSRLTVVRRARKVELEVVPAERWPAA